jgi:plasmid stability protein
MAPITIPDIPDDVRDELTARAARAGRSLEEYLRIELIELARRSSPDDVLRQVRSCKQATGTRLSAEEILTYRDADRK